MRKNRPSPPAPLPPAGEGCSPPRPACGERAGERGLLENAKQLRSNQTDTELKLWYHLRAHRFMGLKFKRLVPIGRYIADFVCVERKLIVELDGGQHAEQTAYDTERDDRLRSEGFTVLRFWNNEVMQELEGVLEKIRLVLSERPSPRPSPRARGEGVDLLPSPACTPRVLPSGRGRGAGGEGE